MARSIRIGFAMEWDTYPDKAKQLKAIADAAKNADALIRATDPDREGEAISWHVREVLKKRRRSRRASNGSPSTPSPSRR